MMNCKDFLEKDVPEACADPMHKGYYSYDLDAFIKKCEGLGFWDATPFMIFSQAVRYFESNTPESQTLAEEAMNNADAVGMASMNLRKTYLLLDIYTSLEEANVRHSRGDDAEGKPLADYPEDGLQTIRVMEGPARMRFDDPAMNWGD